MDPRSFNEVKPILGGTSPRLPLESLENRMAGSVRRPPLSVIMSVYNNGAHLDQAIWSVRQQSFGAFELLIMDDGSTDESAAIISRHAVDDSRIIAAHQPNRGLVAALNRMLAKASAPLIARMDGDDVAHPDRFARQMAYMKAKPETIVLGTQIRLIDYDGAPLPKKVFRPLAHDAIVASFGKSASFAHNSVIYQAAAVRAVGGYRAAFRHCEDLDLWLRLAPRGQFANLPDYLVDYRIYPGQVSQRHLVEQTINATIAILFNNYIGRGAPDPLGDLAHMPDITELESVTRIPGLAASIRARVAQSILWSPDALANDGLPLLLDYIAETPLSDLKMAALSRAAARLGRAGHWGAAQQLAAALFNKWRA